MTRARIERSQSTTSRTRKENDAVVSFPLAARWSAGVAVACAVWGVASVAMRPREGETVVRVAALQPGVSTASARRDAEARDRRILDVLSAQTRAAGSQGAKLVVWPEAALRADPQRVALVSPYIDARATAASFVSNARFDTFDAHAVSRWTQWYAAGAEPVAGERAPVPLNHPRISPALADPGGLPPLAIHVGDAEVLLDDARTYAARATAAGVDVTLRVWPDMIHAFPTFGEGFES